MLRSTRHRLSGHVARIVIATAALSLPAPQVAQAAVLSEDELAEESTELGAVMRSFGFLMAGDILAPPYAPSDSSPTGSGIFDARLYFQRKTSSYKFVIHPQLTSTVRSHALGGSLSLGRGLPPPRWLPLSYDLADEPTISARADIDWLYFAYHRGPITVTLGRQAVSFGRGRLWRTADLISTFALTEIDTEYKPGSDALRVDWSIGERTNLTVVAAAGELESAEHDAEITPQGSSALAQLKHGWSRGELGLLGGWVRGDGIIGIDGIADLGPFDMYGELTVAIRSADSLAAPSTEDPDRPIFKAMLGASLKPTPKLTIIPELFYNGFGSAKAETYLPIALSERVLIGEQPTLGQLYAGWVTDTELHPLWHLVSTQIVNLRDPSALISLGLSHNFADNVKLLFGGYAPIGQLPEAGLIPTLRSEFGNYPYFFFTELKGVI